MVSQNLRASRSWPQQEELPELGAFFHAYLRLSPHVLRSRVHESFPQFTEITGLLGWQKGRAATRRHQGKVESVNYPNVL